MWLDADGTRQLMQIMQNPLTDTEVATVTSTDEDEWWFLVFEWQEIGYVEDDDADELDAGAILESMRKGNEQANEERERHGWAPLEIVGWHEPPHYDTKTRNLTWSLLGRSDGEDVLNRNIRLLGRRGVMSVTLVAGPDEIEAASAEVDRLLEGFRFRPGSRYAEFVAGDRVAEIGLAALVAGGAGALAVKSGLLARFWKAIVAGFLAIVAAIKRFFGRGKAADAGRQAESGSVA
jgi:uncharacterized membrane-anchored protein